MLQSFFDHLPLEEFQYDVLAGVSIGAVNAATLAGFDYGQEQESLDVLKQYWFVFKTDEIFVNWKPWGPIAGFWKQSFLDDTPTHNRINDGLQPFMKKVAYQSVNANDGTVYRFDESLDPKLQGESVAASASIPVAFYPTSTIGDLQLVDGGTFTDLNLQDAIDRCREDVGKDEDIIVDIVMCNSDPVTIDDYQTAPFFRPYHIYQRQKDFQEYYTTMNDIMQVTKANPNVSYRYVVTASEHLPSGPIPIIVRMQDI